MMFPKIYTSPGIYGDIDMFNNSMKFGLRPFLRKEKIKRILCNGK